MRKYFSLLSIAGVTAAIIVTNGFGCGLGWQPVGLETATLSSSLEGGLDTGDNGDLVIVSGQRTVSVAYYEQVLENMLSMAEVTSLSNTSRQIINNRIGSLSENGSVLTVNAPMLQTMTVIGAEVCSAMIFRERQQANNRVYFTEILSRNNISQITAMDVELTARRLSRAFWQKNISNDELDEILQATSDMISENTQNNSTAAINNVAIFICSGMISSTSAYSM